MKSKILAAAFIAAICGSACSFNGKDKNTATWEEYLGGPERNHFSSLDQINTANVQQLKAAWEFHTLDTGQMQCNPIIVGKTMYGMTASARPFAVHAGTGKLIWKWQQDKGDASNTSRGLSYWAGGKDERIFFTNGPWLYAVNAKTGEAVKSFGKDGRTDLRSGLGDSSASKYVVSNAPGTIYKDLIIMPLRVQESSGAAPGHIQAFNVKTGSLVWTFKTIPEPGSPGYETWPKDAYLNKEIGGANNWAGMSIDRTRSIVYVSTGSAAFDFYGGNRIGSNLFANCLLALDAQTGKRKWHFQFVHHDILDRDPPAAPNLLTITRNGKKVNAVAQVTKQGLIFVFNRETGEPLFPVEERPVPASDIPGEQAWPTQPFPVKPAPFARISLAESEIHSKSPNRPELLDALRKARNEGPFTPLGNNGTIIFPGLDGGAEWGGAATDPEGNLYVNSNEIPWLLSLGIKRSGAGDGQSGGKGHRSYLTHCSSCHGPERKGNPSSGFPSLANVSSRRSADNIFKIITQGKGMMPGFGSLPNDQRNALVNFLMDKELKQKAIVKKEPEGNKEAKDVATTSYGITGFKKFLDADGFPAIEPPWGTLNAINLNTGDFIWKIPFGEYPELNAKGIVGTGAESYGGPVVTGGGLLFIAGTKDRKFKAYDKRNGKLLWETLLPAAGFATPSTYEVDGKQYLVIACGGNKLGAPGADVYIAYCLP